ncbi:MAG: glycoside hydrolase family 65 protein [Candidatus Omnitrophica bacterium]|nr:glycoside hydrolase family 65 protein [Candidatus Omnitrophota bacterium]
MSDLYSTYTADELWLIKETEWAKPLQNIRESQFAMGNGFIGSRGVLEELPTDAEPGTYLSGVYDKIGAQVSELVNLPNPINFKFSINGEKVGLIAMDHLEHRRVLNMKKAVLVRRTVYSDSRKRRYEYESLRFLSMANKNVGAMQIVFTPLDGDCTVEINTGIDTSVSNSGLLSEGRKRHFRVKELGQQYKAGYLAVETLNKRFDVIYWSGFYYETRGRKVFAEDNIFSLKVAKGQTVTFTKVFCIKHFPRRADLRTCRDKALKIFRRSFLSDFSKILDEHVRAWERMWGRIDILIEGTANLQQNLRFNIYHMAISGHEDNGLSSVGARTLSGEGYRGHVFWDTEIFLMPFYLFNFPKVARNLLLYRYRRLGPARANAKADGFEGAKFPWESADTGTEETPEWARDIDRTIIRIYTHKMEHHITADIAYAIQKYHLVTGDSKFMADYGYEMFFEIARFWASRAVYNKRQRRYVIKHVIGPDEFHMDVNNNAYTNEMARWTLATAVQSFREVSRRPGLYRKVKDMMGLKREEVRGWNRIASLLKMNMRRDGVIEQFDGYFRRKRVPLAQTDENGMPLLPPKIRPADFGKTQLVKQADVLMLLDLLGEFFSPKALLKNYEYYIARTLHQSSLSAPVHAKVACEAGDLNRAYSFFNVALRTDVSNMYGNTYEGIHAASLGGTWQAVVFGFAGVRAGYERLSVDPRMPLSWKKMVFSLHWHGVRIALELTNDKVKIEAFSSKKGSLKINIFGRPALLQPNKAYVFERKARLRKRRHYYY